MSIFDQIAIKIIKEQELIIGPIAWFEAGKVSGLHIIDQKLGTISIDNADAGRVVDELVAQYEHLFGKASHEVCKEAVASLITELTPTQVPLSLK